jgi:hypothetical protein
MELKKSIVKLNLIVTLPYINHFCFCRLYPINTELKCGIIIISSITSRTALPKSAILLNHRQQSTFTMAYNRFSSTFFPIPLLLPNVCIYSERIYSIQTIVEKRLKSCLQSAKYWGLKINWISKSETKNTC